MTYDAPMLHERQTVGEPHRKYQSVIDHFDSLEEFLARLRASQDRFSGEALARHHLTRNGLASEFNIKQMYRGKGSNRQLHFNMCPTFDDALRLAEYGWPEGRERVAEKEAEVRNLMRDMIEAPAFHHDLVGQEVNVPEFLMGTPEHMIGFDVTQTRHKFLRVTVDVNCRCDACGRRAHDAQPNPPEWAMVRGAVVALLVRALIRYGFEVEVVVGAVAFHEKSGDPFGNGWEVRDGGGSRRKAHLSGRFKHTTSVTIHRPGWQFDFDRLVFCTAHEAFTRKLLFRYEEDWIIERLGGYPVNMSHDSTPQVVGHLSEDYADHPDNMPELGESDVHLDSFPVLTNRLSYRKAQDAFGTVQAGAKWVLDRLKEVGVTFR